MARGPARPPAGAVVVDPAVDVDLSDKTQANPPGTTFWLRPGRHTLGDDRFGQVIPKTGNTYLGAPGAVLDGKGRNYFAFTQQASGVTVRYLTITGFVAPHNQGVVNHDSGDGWVVEHNTIEKNSGAAMMAGEHQRIRGNCLRDNGQYGINAYKQGNTITDLVVEGNEIVGNNTDDWERKLEGCGCTGGLKLWAVDGADLRNNWIHDNRGPGLWADVNNNDILVEDNLFEENDSAAIIYETSYNAIIRDNVMRRNNWVEGREFSDRGDTFPSSAIYLSESGGEPRIPARTDKIDVHSNLLENNWSGITAWENADRFCNSPANPSGDCTRLVPKASRCAQPGIARGTLYADCRWKTQRVSVHDNRFVLDPAAVPGCRSKTCGRMALLANYGTYPAWSPYDGEVVQQAITFDQDNRWYANTYVGPWTFVGYDVSRELSAAKWRAEPYRQDKGSRFR
ncbi:MAG: right-handed parallel beta-helix repeat-containing protein [Streptosporangiales bacterium]|nr:right-handed parallel beta-helix repeat-containing protein [Streptosporangiales bacterium]